MLHFISFALVRIPVNSWQEYMTAADDNCTPRKKILNLLAFQNDAGLALTMCNTNGARKRGRPSNNTKELPRKVHNAEEGAQCRPL